jgi:polyphosphate kinase 2 (PPK2 family)
MDKRLRFMAHLIEPLMVAPGTAVKLSRDHDPGYTGQVTRQQAAALLADGVDLLAQYQDRLAAQDTFGVLLILQGLDASGKDSTIKHVMSGVNPQAVEVRAFKQPSAEELDHDFLWRYQRAAPGRGRIGIFNRSHWDEYQQAFDIMLSQTSTKWAPWYVVPADHKWFSRLATAAVLASALSAINPTYPPADPAVRDEMTRARAGLVAELGIGQPAAERARATPPH